MHRYPLTVPLNGDVPKSKAGPIGVNWVGLSPLKISRGSLKNLGHTILKCYIVMVCLPLIFKFSQQKSKVEIELMGGQVIDYF